MIDKETYFSVAKFFNLFNLFESYSCSVLKPKEPILNYVIGGGIYNCENLHLSFTYFYFFIGIFLIFLLFILFFYKISFYLPDLTKKLFRTTILNLILLPSTTFFLLSLHIDVPYLFLTLFCFIYWTFFDFLDFINHYLVYIFQTMRKILWKNEYFWIIWIIHLKTIFKRLRVNLVQHWPK